MTHQKGTLCYPRTEPVLSVTAWRTISQRIDEYCTSLQQLRVDVNRINFACRFIRSKQFPSILYFEVQDPRVNLLWKPTTQVIVREYFINDLVEAKLALVNTLMNPDSKPVEFSSKKSRILGVKEFYYFFIIIDDFIPEMFSSNLALSVKRSQKVDEEKYSKQSVENNGKRVTTTRLLKFECPICLDKFSTQVLPCGHAYCESCLETWCLQEHNCPMCRIYVKSSDVRESWQLCQDLADLDKIREEYREYLLSFPYRYIDLFPER